MFTRNLLSWLTGGQDFRIRNHCRNRTPPYNALSCARNSGDMPIACAAMA